ncbi:MAG: hypothetical protein Q8L98_08110, partial [Chlamydiales bacterium]|nr:hypothetical protein [Chlamydiales bacterium]
QLKQHKEFMQKPHPIACRLFDIRSRGLVRPLTEKEKKTIEKLQEKLREPPWSPEEKRVFEGILHGDLVSMPKTPRDFIDFDKRLMGAECCEDSLSAKAKSISPKKNVYYSRTVFHHFKGLSL